MDRLEGMTGAQYVGRQREAGMAQAGLDDVYWFLAMPVPAGALDAADPRAGLDAALAPFHEPFRAVVAATPPELLRRDEIHDRDPAPAWGEGPVTLIGDAAHPMPPNAGQGAAQALEDAVVLGRCLASGDPIAGLRRYERARIPRTAAIVELSRSNARLFLVRAAPLVFVRDLALRLVPERAILKRLVAIGKAELDPPADT
jgi:2-polyprenyl-6-methoxyphenol hydroxylase-like FAD-dependent oxidoreductase